MNTPDIIEEKVAEYLRLCLNPDLSGPEPIEDMKTWLRNTLTDIYQRGKEEVAEDAIKMADALELECGLDGDKGTKQWMAFKGFRNTLRDKYLTNPQDHD